ncbi:MAG: peptide chain release factor N(5)-glutamine methyltransferase [Methylobacteriaceae bacterium]|nr:peptide chain release factor N(5)-glutamine methyltransferase [Methylobacteriaceae bacterium]MBV9634941.1 peptide chain release factor N(5)-glutamine methyltransferase [Methylobacteriaceae bacterium]
MDPRFRDTFGPELSIGKAVEIMTASFAQVGYSTPGLDARLLLADIAGVKRIEFIVAPERPVGADWQRLTEAAERRLAGEPVARLIGSWEFWSLPFALDASTLVPRPETETVVEAVLAAIDRSSGRDASLRILDLGTGCGAILVALLSELPNAFGIGVDRELGAARLAQANAERNSVAKRAAFIAGDWATATVGNFDVVVSNPPYVASGAIATLDPEVRCHDPPLALDGGPDGLCAYRSIIADLPRLLAREGTAAFEVGAGQAEAVVALVEGANLRPAIRRDLAGRDRVVLGLPSVRQDTPNKPCDEMRREKHLA